METIHVAATVHGRVLVEGTAASGTLVGFHGYGELAENSLEQMRRIPGAGSWKLVAVQALHPFYRRSREIVASWMTRQDRELAIADNVAYVASVLSAAACTRPLVFAGFSQGAAMAARAASRLPADGVILLGGDIPPDVIAAAPAGLPPFLLGRGVRDEWYTAEKLKKDLSFLEPLTSVALCEFEGEHEWSDAFREAAGRFLDSVCRRTAGATNPRPPAF